MKILSKCYVGLCRFFKDIYLICNRPPFPSYHDQSDEQIKKDVEFRCRRMRIQKEVFLKHFPPPEYPVIKERVGKEGKVLGK